MYKATNIDTDKAIKAINDSRAIQKRESQLRSEKERSYIEGLNKGLDIPTQDIRDNIASVDEACAMFADRIRKAIARDKDQ